jgi:hypothetical protein
MNEKLEYVYAELQKLCASPIHSKAAKRIASAAKAMTDESLSPMDRFAYVISRIRNLDEREAVCALAILDRLKCLDLPPEYRPQAPEPE